MNVYDLKISHMSTPVIDWNPEFSWKIESEDKNVLQDSYRIIVRELPVGKNEEQQRIVWDSGIVHSREQAFVEYVGEAFQSRTTYSVQVTVWDNFGNSASCENKFETGMLQISDWTARWIECPFERKAQNEYKFGNAYPAVIFEKKVNINKPIKKARIYATSHGVYRLEVNKTRADERELAPEFTPYDRILYYQTYDVTKLLSSGENFLAMTVADGWYFSAQAGPVMKNRHKEPSCLIQLEVIYEDGEKEHFASDGNETCRLSQIVYSDLYQGEKQDFTMGEQKTFPVLVKDYGYDMLHAQPMEPIVAAKLTPATGVLQSPAGEQIVDFGQVMCGRARVHIDVPAGQEIVMEYFEVLSEDGNYINTMFAPQKDTVVSNGKPIEHEAIFTFHGFRYIRVTGLKEVRKEDFTAVLLTTKKDNAGSFETSDERVNRLYENIRWSQYSNMMSVPTDCPSREKAGWTGDILIYAKTALLNENMTPFLRSWLNSVRADQTDNGTVMIVSPYMQLYDGMLKAVCKTFGDDEITGVAGWSDAIVWVPYDMYLSTGNKSVLSENYEAMKKWADYIVKTAATKRGTADIPVKYDKYLWNTGFHFGEWLVPSRPNKDIHNPYAVCEESACYIAPFFGYMTISKIAEISEVLGKKEETDYYCRLSQLMKEAIQEGIIKRNALPEYLMGAYVLAFAFDLVPKELMASYKEKLVHLVHEHGDCLDTGFLATPYLLPVLIQLGERKLAYKLFWQNKRPSWLYEVEHGATTIWEGWDADDAKKDGRYISFNHYAFGCVDEFMCRQMAGIDTDTVGFKHLIIRPDTECGLTECKRTFMSEAGLISVDWNRNQLEVIIPCNTTATIFWKGSVHEVGSGKYLLE